LTGAEELRLAGRWDEALATLEGRDDADALVERVLILADQNMLVRDMSSELDEAIGAVESEASRSGDRHLRAFALARRGLALHGGFLRDRSAGEPPGELELFERALELRRELGDQRGVAESLFHVGLVHQVVRDDHDTARPFFEESYDRAVALDDDVLASYALRHVAFCDEDAGDRDTAERRQEEALELRRQAGWIAGVAAQLAAVAELRAQRGRTDEARELAREARSILSGLGAERLLAMVDAELERLEAA
jgi:tetratricopeptide (TPR) repeat protein